MKDPAKIDVKKSLIETKAIFTDITDNLSYTSDKVADCLDLDIFTKEHRATILACLFQITRVQTDAFTTLAKITDDLNGN